MWGVSLNRPHGVMPALPKCQTVGRPHGKAMAKISIFQQFAISLP